MADSQFCIAVTVRWLSSGCKSEHQLRCTRKALTVDTSFAGTSRRPRGCALPGLQTASNRRPDSNGAYNRSVVDSEARRNARLTMSDQGVGGMGRGGPRFSIVVPV